MLNDKQAVEIYQRKLDLLTPRSFKSCLQDTDSRIKGKSAMVAKDFGVSAKTIRDIWTRRTWTTATSILWGKEEKSAIGDESPYLVYLV